MDLTKSDPNLNSPYSPPSPTMSQMGAGPGQDAGAKEEEIREQMREEEDRGSTQSSEPGVKMDLSHNEADSLLRQSWNSYSTNLGQFYGLFEKNVAKLTFFERFEAYIQSDMNQTCGVTGPPSAADIDSCLLQVKHKRCGKI